MIAYPNMKPWQKAKLCSKVLFAVKRGDTDESLAQKLALSLPTVKAATRTLIRQGEVTLLKEAL